MTTQRFVGQNQGFSSIMKKVIIFFIFIPLVYSELHRFMTAYTAINGQTIAGIPEVSAVTTLDEKQIYYNDSNIKKLIPRQDWVKEFTSTYMWKEYIKTREKLQQIYKNNIPVIMQRFNQSHGVHTYQRMYGCEYDDETGDSQVFDVYAYDGEDLDLKENRYITPVQQGVTTVMMWNDDKTLPRYLKQYYDYKCVYWLKEFLHLSKATFKKTDPPKVSLLQKYPDYYVECHVTGFLFRNTSILWRKNGQAMNDSSNLVKSGETLPNEDGTFQRRLTLYVLPDEWREDQYACVVEHKSLTETIQKILTEDQIKRNKSASNASYMNLALVIISVSVVLIGLCVLLKHWKKLKDSYYTSVYLSSKTARRPSMSKLNPRKNMHRTLFSPIPLTNVHPFQKPASERLLVVPSQRWTISLSRTFSFTVPHRWTDLPNPSQQLSPFIKSNKHLKSFKGSFPSAYNYHP